ncbi:ligase-associated DNA damage response endonuclease PdeM [Alphaproteobacteria bacterium]|nr:ligase-associated DNA damage response endonuclease PdeM [Alphaproteobacteria bacterium]
MKVINFNNHEFKINNDGILFWLEKKIAIVSDLHLEKGSSFASLGQFIPPYDSEETLKKLINFLKTHEVQTIILLGDTFHDGGALNRMSSKVKSIFDSLVENYEIIFVLGNHENKMKSAFIKFYERYIVDDIHFLHEAVLEKKYQISGHFHPVASLKIDSKKITEKCLIHSENYLIMPAFGEFTGGLNINNPVFKPFLNRNYYIYFLTKKSVYKFASHDIKT